MTSAAAVFAVVAAVMFGFILNNNGITPPPPPLPHGSTAPSAPDVIIRINETVNNPGFIDTHGLTEEPIEMYISFANPMTLEELDSVLEQLASDSGDVQVIKLWNNDVALTLEEQEASAMFFNGARVLANGGLYSELIDLPQFTWIELGGGLIDDSNFSPITIHGNPAEIAETPSPADTDPAESTDRTEPAEPTEPEAPAIDGDIDNNGEEPVVNPEEPVVIPYDDGLLELDINNATSVNFINGNRFVLTTPSQVLLYEIIIGADDNHTLTAISGFVAVNPQVIYIDNLTGTLLITGGDAFGRITDLFLAEGESGELRQLDTAVITQNGEEIRTALYRNGEVVLRTRNDSISAIYTAGRNGGFALNKVEQTDGTLVILSFTADGFKYARINDGATRTFRYNTIGFNGEEIDLNFAALEGELRFMRSNDGSNFAVITDNGTFVWNAATGALTDSAIYTTSVRFHRHSANFISDEWGNWYAVDGAELIAMTEEEVSAEVRKPVFSASYKLSEITQSAVIIEVIS
jgi:hypothetical protein